MNEARRSPLAPAATSALPEPDHVLEARDAHPRLRRMLSPTSSSVPSSHDSSQPSWPMVMSGPHLFHLPALPCASSRVLIARVVHR